MADQDFNMLSSSDLDWSSGYQRENVFSNYYDYFFSGEDVKVYIDGLFDPEDELDLVSFAYSVRQEKQPLYGFWSYNYDAVMYGTRIISGEFTVYTRYPQRITNLLRKASDHRMKTEQKSMKEHTISKLNPEDELNLQKYWAITQLDRVTKDTESSDRTNIFSAHAPFNFVIIYGAEEVALSPMGLIKGQDYVQDLDNLDRMIVSDINQRSIKTDNVVSPMKVIIQQVNLMNMSTGYTPGGQPVVESYQFIARDFYFTETDVAFIKKMYTNNLSGIDNSTVDAPSTSTTASNGTPS